MSEAVGAGAGATAEAVAEARYVLAFGEADHRQVRLLGGKGAGLARLTAEGFPAPPGFIITTDACRSVTAHGAVPERLFTEVLDHLRALEQSTAKTFGSGPFPLLLSVRSGAPVSMPGMMDTVLNLGLNRETAIALAEASGDRRFVADVLVRFHRMYSEIVLGGSGEDVAEAAEGIAERLVEGGADPGTVYDELWAACQRAIVDDVGAEVPGDPRLQLQGAIEAVFRSWNNRRAVTYRDFHRIPHDLGTAVVVQSMVFGNLGSPSGSGVVFTRNPVTGEPRLYGEYLEGGQGEDVVAGTATPEQIDSASVRLPELFEELRTQCARLERMHGDVLDIEFTVERGRLHLLQTRSAKRTPEAAIRIAADFLREPAGGNALAAVSAAQIRQLERPQFQPGAIAQARSEGRLLTVGVGASPGQVSGALVLDPDRATARAAQGEDVILARPITSPVDLHGMIAARGIVTATGGSTSHAAVVARALGKPCVVGCGEARIEPDRGRLAVGDRVVEEGDAVSIDGLSGEVLAGALAMTAPAASNPDLGFLLGEADRLAGCRILGRVTLAGDVAAVVERGGAGVVTSIDDVLATTGHLEGVIESLQAQRELDSPDLGALEATIAETFEPLLHAAGDAEVGIRAIDFLADESRELMQQTQLLTHYPQLSVPMGMPALLRAQLAGLARAASASGHRGRIHLAVRHVSDPLEARALRELSRDAGAGRITAGAYLTSPRGALLSTGIVEASDVVWVEVRVMQAAMFGLPPRHLLTQRPLDDYVKRGLIATDPRFAIDPTLHGLLEAVARAGAAHPRCEIGMRLSGPVSEEIAATLHRIGFRMFAVDADELRPARLAFGKAPAGAAREP